MKPLTFHLVFHTHWDREWHLPHATYHARLVTMLDNLLDGLEADAGLRSFLLDGQTVLLEDYLQARPDRVDAVRELVRAGRLQVGPWYVLADEQVPAGESLVRNLLLGAADATRWGGRLDVLYSPDAFGHPACWPELARGAGIVVEDDLANSVYPLAANADGKDPVYVGRIRKDPSLPNALDFWCVSDNLRKGAALNAVQITEAAIQMGLI